MNRILISGTAGHMDTYRKAVHDIGLESDTHYAPRGDIQRYSGLILCGGGDLNPRWYGALAECSNQIDPAREQSDFYLISQFGAQHKPILGICRGMQVLNVVFGGTLRQDLGVKNRKHQGQGGTDRYHEVVTKEFSLMRRLYGRRTIVNSYHHQAVERVGEGFQITMESEDDVPEALEHDTLPILAVQWHPERIVEQEGNADGAAIFRVFAEQIQKSGTV